jgi:hypothetical protein
MKVVAYHSLYGLLGFGVEREIGKVIVSRWYFEADKPTMALVITLVLFMVLWNSKFSLTTFFSCFCD